MQSFSADWLALREPADHAARALGAATELATRLGSRAETRALDLAAGTGSNVRFLLPRTPHIRHWMLVDHDSALLDVAKRSLEPVARAAGRSVDTQSLDLRSLRALPVEGCALVTASALLDLVSKSWLGALATRCHAANADVLFALTYDGRIECDPLEPGDALVRDLVNAHQRRDKGFGPALGPDAAEFARVCFAALDYQVLCETSDWVLAPSMGELQSQLVGGWAHAAREMSSKDASEIETWRRARLAHIASGHSTMRVGHRDLAAWRSDRPDAGIEGGPSSGQVARSRA